MSAAEELRRAAEVLRERGGAATPGPWVHIPDSVCGPGTLGGSMTADYDEHVLMSKDNAPVDAAYIATVHPGVGLLLADWLVHVAEWVDRDAEYGKTLTSGDEHALKVARAINGDAS